jgi:hypothetical protein
MRWPWFPPRRGEIFALVLAALIAAVVIFTAVHPPRIEGSQATGFGPDWYCTPVWHGVCFKLAAPAKK